MGLTSSSERRIKRLALQEYDIDLITMGDFNQGFAEQDEVQHYMPPTFPLIPELKPEYVRICEQTWTLIQNASTPVMEKYQKSGIVLFYDEFYYRLFQRDAKIISAFPDKLKRGKVLISAIRFILSAKADTALDITNVVNRSRFLGHRHRTIPNIKPHQFSLYVSVAVEVMMHWLGDLATQRVAIAWSNTMGFILQHILEAYLYRRVDPYECYQNTTISAVRDIMLSRAEFGDTTRRSKLATSQGTIGSGGTMASMGSMASLGMMKQPSSRAIGNSTSQTIMKNASSHTLIAARRNSHNRESLERRNSRAELARRNSRADLAAGGINSDLPSPGISKEAP